MENLIPNEEKKCCNFNWKEPKFMFKILGMVLLAGIVIVSLVRERIVNPMQNQVTVYGQGKVSYQPDEAKVTLGVQVDRVWSAEGALKQLNEKMARVMEAEKALGVQAEDIKTGSYSLYPQYDYKDGVSSIAGYTASQNLIIKVRNIQADAEMVGKIISAASGMGVNQIQGVDFSPSNLNDIKQEARLAAIADAKSKAPALFKASGVRAGKILGWYENNVQSPDVPMANYDASGIGGMGGAKAVPSPQVPSGTQEITIEIGLNYEVK
jgi:hypothetical protein